MRTELSGYAIPVKVSAKRRTADEIAAAFAEHMPQPTIVKIH